MLLLVIEGIRNQYLDSHAGFPYHWVRVQFEWDAVKALRNLARHGVDFEDAIYVFLDPCRFEMEDDRCDYGESRF